MGQKLGRHRQSDNLKSSYPKYYCTINPSQIKDLVKKKKFLKSSLEILLQKD